LVVKLKHQLEKEFGVPVNIVDLFTYVTIEKQAGLFAESIRLSENSNSENSNIEELKF